MGGMNQRKRIYVDRHVQGGIVVRLVLLWLASAGLAAGVFFFMQFCANPTEGLASYVLGAWRHLFPLVLAFVVTLPMAVLHLLRFTHRFAGPIVSLRRAMHDLASNRDVAELKFRDRDYWKDLADEFNRAAALMAETRARVAELEAELQGRRSPQQDVATADLTEPVAAG